MGVDHHKEGGRRERGDSMPRDRVRERGRVKGREAIKEFKCIQISLSALTNGGEGVFIDH